MNHLLGLLSDESLTLLIRDVNSKMNNNGTRRFSILLNNGLSDYDYERLKGFLRMYGAEFLS
ncbi:hypothetical protein AcetOrient_orf00581 [Acetobacter orientalis]|uniref:Uncharacterized protein n=1 Tax=Acetobacter orientalis TaxID=146474 RepID=A0A2Z5ZE43_9PROT|nr:hypothetical protein AcetOrient_orf00581 [Acetobacter orientalis]